MGFLTGIIIFGLFAAGHWLVAVVLIVLSLCQTLKIQPSGEKPNVAVVSYPQPLSAETPEAAATFWATAIVILAFVGLLTLTAVLFIAGHPYWGGACALTHLLLFRLFWGRKADAEEPKGDQDHMDKIIILVFAAFIGLLGWSFAEGELVGGLVITALLLIYFPPDIKQRGKAFWSSKGGLDFLFGLSFVLVYIAFVVWLFTTGKWPGSLVCLALLFAYFRVVKIRGENAQLHRC
jgi:hypothetical protein